MATRSVPGTADKTPRRVVPGAPPPAQSKAGKKGKASSKAADASAVKVPDATSAALIETAPANPKQVANGLKVTSQDLAEQAETQAAVAAVDAVQSSSEPSATVTAPSTPAQKVISDRIDELSKKAKNATITVAIDELKSLLNKVQVAEAGSQPSSSKANVESEGKARLVLLLQFLHLFNLFHPNPAGPPSFVAQRTMPAALEMSTGQQVAAIAKIYDQLANGPLEGGGGDALETLANIARGSSDEVLPDVSFATVRSMILKLTAPPTADAEAPQPGATGLDGPSQGFVPLDQTSPNASPVSFIQASEILDRSGEEPEGGQPSAVPVEGAATSQKGEKAGAGAVLGDASATAGKADGSAAWAVKEAVNTTVAEPKLNWAALAEEDDGELGDAPVFEPLPSSTTSALVTPAPGTPLAGESSAPAAPAAATESGEAPSSPKAKKGKQTSGPKGGAARTGNGAAGAAGGKPQAQKPKAQPKVDEDGFILQESKRTKYLQQKQQQQRGGGRGGRGGASAGRGGRGANNGTRGGKGAEYRQSNNAAEGSTQ